jgi:hypothetical protein
VDANHRVQVNHKPSSNLGRPNTWNIRDKDFIGKTVFRGTNLPLV